MIRHNEIWDITATLLMEVEPDLQEIALEEIQGRTAITTDGARLGISSNVEDLSGLTSTSGYLTHMLHQTEISHYKKKNEREKKRAYECVWEIEHDSFTPLCCLLVEVLRGRPQISTKHWLLNYPSSGTNNTARQ